MKIKKLLLILLVFAMSLVGCDNSSTYTPQTVKYESVDAVGNTYILTITEKTSRAAYTVTKGDSYTLNIKQQGQPDKESKGSVSTIKDDGELTMKPTKADDTFGVSINDGKMTAINGTITLEDGGKIPAPGAVTPVENVGGPFTSIADMAAWLSAQPINTPASAHTVKLNVSDLGGYAGISGSAGYVLIANDTKYVNLDLSGSTFTDIVGSAFYRCSNLTNVTIPDSVTSIKNAAFLYCTSLASIKIPDSVTSIGELTFGCCFNLTSVTIGNSINSIGDRAFEACTNLTSLNIPNSVISIGMGAFEGCSSLTSVTIPNSVTSIGYYAFFDCTSLTAINVGAGNTAYSSQDGVLYNKDKTVLNTYPAGKKENTFIIPNSVTSIGNRAFGSCINLTSVTIGNNVTSIDGGVFSYCTSLTSVTIPDSVTNIDGGAFSYCTSLTSVTIPNSVTNIGQGAFESCSNLTSVIIGNSVTGIRNSAFRGCTSLTSVTIPDSVTSIDGGAFSHCTNLTSITIPDSVTSIGSQAFFACTSLTVITVDAGNTVYSSQDGILYNKDKTTLHAYPAGKEGTTFTIPNDVTRIGNGAFSSCTKLTNVTIPNSVTIIGNDSFSSCTKLTNVTIPDSVTIIGLGAFLSCANLTSVKFEGIIYNLGSDGSGVSMDPFNGDLRDKYLAANGGIGTYTTTAPVNRDSVWTKR